MRRAELTYKQCDPGSRSPGSGSAATAPMSSPIAARGRGDAADARRISRSFSIVDPTERPAFIRRSATSRTETCRAEVQPPARRQHRLRPRAAREAFLGSHRAKWRESAAACAMTMAIISLALSQSWWSHPTRAAARTMTPSTATSLMRCSVGDAFKDWKAYKVEVGNECTSCHRLGVSNIAALNNVTDKERGTALDFVLRATSQEDAKNLLRQPRQSGCRQTRRRCNLILFTRRRRRHRPSRRESSIHPTPRICPTRTLAASPCLRMITFRVRSPPGGCGTSESGQDNFKPFQQLAGEFGMFLMNALPRRAARSGVSLASLLSG